MFFTYKTFDCGSCSCIFYQCTLKQDIGGHRAGHKVDEIVIDFHLGIVRVDEVIFELKMELGDEVVRNRLDDLDRAIDPHW